MRRSLPAARLGPAILIMILATPSACGGPAEVPDGGDPDGTRWIDDAGLGMTGFSRVSFVARDGNQLSADVYRSTTFVPANGPIWFVMHGASRDVERYIRAAAPVAERYGALAIAIHFSREAYPTGDDYTLGITTAGQAIAGASWRAPEDMLYAEMEYVFDLVLGSIDGRQTGYYMFGHSAGAQFTHRLLTFLPTPRVIGAVAANAGWYTLPAADDPFVHSMPYGLIGGPVAPDDLTSFFETPFAVLLGENDTSTAETDDLLRGTPQADAQGANRLERGQHYFAVAQEQATTLGAEFAWRLEIAPRAGHDAEQVIASAGFLTFEREPEACTPTPAATTLIITEILADPPDALAGDANADGVRDPADDEFVEIVNHGADSVCLAGWVLGDATSTERHIFPLGPALAPGEILVVFGGGVPTGTFRGARVQWAADGLSLQHPGDVLTLRDPDGTVVQQVSWGDCAQQQCADDHWPGTLAVDGSLTRPATPGAEWAPHPSIGGVAYSPGFAPDASATTGMIGPSIRQ